MALKTARLNGSRYVTFGGRLRTLLPSVSLHAPFSAGWVAKKAANSHFHFRRSYCLRANLHHVVEMISVLRPSANLSAPSARQSYTRS